MKPVIDFTNVKPLLAEFQKSGLKISSAPEQVFAAIFAARSEEIGNRLKFAHSPPPEVFGPDDESWSRPVAALKDQIERYGEPAEDIVVEPEKRESVEKLLVGMGIEPRRAAEIVDEAARPDGRISVGAVIGAVAKERRLNEDASGPAFDPSLTPQLLLLLKKFGVSNENVERISRALGSGRVSLRKLARLLEELNFTGRELGVEDVAEIKNLLLKTGLQPGEIDKIVNRYRTPNGGLNLKGFIATLKETAAEGDKALKMALSGEMAQAVAKLLKGAKVIDRRGETDQVRTRNLQRQLNLFKGREGDIPEVPRPRAAVARQAKIAPHSEGRATDLGQETFKRAVVEQIKAELAAKPAGEDKLKALFGDEVEVRIAAGRTGGQAAGKGVNPALAGSNGSARPAFHVDLSAAAGGRGQAQAVARAAVAAPKAAPVRMPPSFLLDQLSGRLVVMLKNGQSTLRLQLRPPELGQLRIDLQVEGNSVKATVVAETSQVQQVLGASGSELRQSLADQGFNLDQFVVLVRDRQEGGASDGSGRDRSEDDGGRSPGNAVDEIESEEVRPRVYLDRPGRVHVVA